MERILALLCQFVAMVGLAVRPEEWPGWLGMFIAVVVLGGFADQRGRNNP